MSGFDFNPFIGNFDRTGRTSSVASSAERLSKLFEAGESISTNDIIRLGASQLAFKATSDGTYEEAQAVGIALTSGLIGEDVEVLFFGVVEDNSFNFTINNPFFLGVNGAISQAPPTIVGEFVTELGQSLGSGAIFLDVSRPSEIVS